MSAKEISLKNAYWLVCQKPDGLFPDTVNSWETALTPEHQFAPIKDTHGTPMFRKSFDAKSGEKALITSTALGIYELWCNGKRVGVKEYDGNVVYDELKPGWTDYSKRVMSFTYDISDYLKDGSNVILAVAAPGWWNGRISFNQYENNDIAFCAAVQVGDRVIYTDETWDTMWGGRVRAADIWDGEICEEKTTKSMEIIISNVSPKTHLLSKVLSSNLFVILQGLLLVIYAAIGILISTKGQLSIDPSVDSLLTATIESGFLSKLITLLPAIIIMMILMRVEGIHYLF